MVGSRSRRAARRSGAPAPDAPFSAQVFKTTIDHYAGRIDYLRVFSGTLKSDGVLMNPRSRAEERVAHLYRTDGAQTVEVTEAGPGRVRGAAEAEGRADG